MDMTKEMLISLGVSEKDADAIFAQHEESKSTTAVENIIEQKVSLADNCVPTQVSALREYAKGQVIRLPDFAPGQPFYARLKRPSLFALIKAGKIPNSLMATVSAMFEKDKKNVVQEQDKLENTTGIFSLMEIMAEAALISPTYKEIKDAGVTLTDEQLTEIFNYTQEGIKSIESFR